MSPLTLFILSLLGLTVLTSALYLFFKWGKNANKQIPGNQDKQDKQDILHDINILQYNVNIKDNKQINIAITPSEKESIDFDLAKESTEPTKSLKMLINASGNVTTEIVTNPVWYSFKGIALKIRAFSAKWPLNLAQSLFVGALLIYAATRLIGLEDYPIFFFSDEAIQTNLASDLIRDGFKNHQEEFLPTYFKNVDKFSLSLTVYAQVIPTMLFNQSIFITRATSVLFTFLGAYWISLILRDIFKIKYWWIGTLFLAISPAWFLHSRTAFETCMMASFFVGFLYYYLRYRQGEPKSLYLALILGALSFYSYNPGRVVVAFAGLIFLITDFIYHWENRKSNVKALLLLALLALPYIRFQLDHPTAQADQLRLLASYWLKPIPLSEKLGTYLSNWVFGLSPGYWFLSNEHDLSRHLMGNAPHLYTITFLFAAIGLILAFKNIRKPAYRVILIALLAAPSGSAIVGIGITRAMVFIIPAVLLISLGFEASVDWITQKFDRWGKKTESLNFRKEQVKRNSLLIFVLLGSVSISLLFNALINGPTWEENYGLSGMQYGAKQLFTRLQEYIKEDPEINLFVSPDWANGTQVLHTYFLKDYPPIQLGNINAYMFNVLPDIVDKTFVITPEEFDAVNESGKFDNIEIVEIIPYPNDEPGFYFIQLEYIDNIFELLAEEVEQRRALKEEQVWLNGETVTIKYSPEDMGEIGNLFDKDPYSVIRTSEANPFVIEIFLPKEQNIKAITAIIGSANIHFQVEIYTVEDSSMQILEISYQGSVDEPQLKLIFPNPIKTDHLRIFVQDLNQTEPAHIHVWELGLETE